VGEYRQFMLFQINVVIEVRQLGVTVQPLGSSWVDKHQPNKKDTRNHENLLATAHNSSLM
jgi:hypothetical protein